MSLRDRLRAAKQDLADRALSTLDSRQLAQIAAEHLEERGDLPISIAALTLRTRDAWWQMPTLSIPVGPHLAVTPQVYPGNILTGRWVVTHLPTGWAAVHHGSCLSCAVDAAEALTNLTVDWARYRPSDAVPRQHVEAVDRAIEIARSCTAVPCDRLRDLPTDDTTEEDA